MFSQIAAIALSLAAFAPAPAQDWYYVDSDTGHANISFIDKASIRTNAGGNAEAAMFSVLAADEDGAAAFRFVIEVQCAAGKSRLMTGETFDSALKSSGADAMDSEWESVDPGTQGESIQKFVCSKGASMPESKSLGSALPLAKGRAMLAEMAGKASK